MDTLFLHRRESLTSTKQSVVKDLLQVHWQAQGCLLGVAEQRAAEQRAKLHWIPATRFLDNQEEHSDLARGFIYPVLLLTNPLSCGL